MKEVKDAGPESEKASALGYIETVAKRIVAR